MNKVAIVSCYFKHNYGSMLQAYATQKILDNMKIENETINVSKNKDIDTGKKKYYMNQFTNISFLKAKLGMIKLKIYKKINKKLAENLKIRDIKFKEFESNFNLTQPYTGYAQLTDICKTNYSNVIVGSDQLWLPVNVVADYYTLNWVPNDINKISYATSFGISEIPKEYREKYIEFLDRMNYISVREQKGIDIIKDLINKEVKLVCDPTLLLKKEEWQEIEAESQNKNFKYIFCYFLGKNIKHRKFVERLKEKTGYQIISINHCDEYVGYSDIFADEVPYDVGPSEFLKLIANAEYICTDSFHGTIFSLIYNKKFFVFRRHQENLKMSTNSRINSILKILDLEQRLLLGDEKIEEVDKEIEYKEINKKLDDFRNNSIKFLTDALKIE